MSIPHEVQINQAENRLADFNYRKTRSEGQIKKFQALLEAAKEGIARETQLLDELRAQKSAETSTAS